MKTVQTRVPVLVPEKVSNRIYGNLREPKNLSDVLLEYFLLNDPAFHGRYVKADEQPQAGLFLFFSCFPCFLYMFFYAFRVFMLSVC